MDERRSPGGPNRPLDNQIVVGLSQLGLVDRELDDRDVAHRVVKKSGLLDLALVEITNPRAAADRLRIPEAAPHSPAPTDAVGEVLLALRQRFGRRYAGWTPVLGRNRAVEQFHGAQEVIHGGGDPVALAEPLALPSRSTGPGRDVRVGLLDTGLFLQPWLAGAWSARYADRLPPQDRFPYAAGHATFVAGLILSQAPGATVEARRVFDDDGVADSWTVGEEIVRMGRSGIDVLNLSFACYTDDGRPPFVLATAVDRIDPDVVVVAAAGNQPVTEPATPLRPAWPAALDDVLAVGAVDARGRRAAFSPNGPWVDVHAAGVGVRSTYLEEASDPAEGRATRFPGGWAQWSGTSFAAGLVSGAVAAGTTPGRVTAREAAQDLLAAVRTDPTVDDTGAGTLRLPLW